MNVWYVGAQGCPSGSCATGYDAMRKIVIVTKEMLQCGKFAMSNKRMFFM